MIRQGVCSKSQGKETVDISKLTVEHIMPQTLSAKWKKTLGEQNARNYKTWLHTLGNLTLTAYNSELSNKPYSDKRECLKDSNLYLNRYFRDINDWNFDEIKERGKHLADIAIKVWPRSPF